MPANLNALVQTDGMKKGTDVFGSLQEEKKTTTGWKKHIKHKCLLLFVQK